MLKKWLKSFEKAMSAAAFAEAGEFETAKETLQEKRRILFAVRGDTSDENAFKYALNMCKRIDAELEILYVSHSVKGTLDLCCDQLNKEGIGYSLVYKNGSLDDAITNYTNAHSDILFVVVEVSEDVDVRSRRAERILSDAWENLKCPLVVVSRAKTAFAAT